MKCAIVYNRSDTKLLSSAYSWTYKDMFEALIKRFEDVLYVTDSCSAKDIDADVIIFYDVHSTHDIKIDGVEKHKAVKVEYFNDPHQQEQDFTRNGVTVHKLGAENRVNRALERGVTKIICPCREAYYQYIAPYLPDDYLLWFPVAPKNRITKYPELKTRTRKVLANGNIWQGENGFRPYEFRSWAFKQPEVFYPKNIVVGNGFQSWLSDFAGALALCDVYVCPKYLEIPLSGGVCFAQENQEYKDLGFEDGRNCIFVNKENFSKKITDFLADVVCYQNIADEGRKQALNYTSERFADFIYGKLNDN